jgi:1-aminocyclopropane-1-carboxylate deaminase/D-cysteine desulfhydrase-like pyridoxal-dependent ACC family enzyme
MSIAEQQFGMAEIQEIFPDETRGKDISVDVLRLDKIHPVISGNKWFKLKYHLQNARNAGVKTILTFGGAWSNHILATACAARLAGFTSIGYIRGEAAPRLSETLKMAVNEGMRLEFVSRGSYRSIMSDASLLSFEEKYGPVYVIPEGGAGDPGIKGCAEILQMVPSPDLYTHILCCIGTGTMFSGLVNGSAPLQQIIGVPVLKGLKDPVAELAGIILTPCKTSNRINIIDQYHFGGYARKTGSLLLFMNDFYQKTGIPTDFVYTGKLFYALHDLLKQDYFEPGSKILVIHSGGLQGNASLPEGTLVF